MDEPNEIYMELKRLNRKTVYSGHVFKTIVDQVRYPSGAESVREVAQHPGGAVALGVFPDGNILLIRQYRYPFDAVIWELPAGKLEPDEQPLACARREFEEETGYSAATWQHLTSIYTSPGFCDEVLHLYLATDI